MRSKMVGFVATGTEDRSATTAALRVTIDGPTASGKTTLGSALARRIGATFLDTGLTFRALSYAMSRTSLDIAGDWRARVLHRPMTLEPAAPGEPCRVVEPEAVFFDGVDITGDIFAPALEPHLGWLAASNSWRAQIVRLHEDIAGQHPCLIGVGRDVSTSIMASAALHIALTASLVVRRERRRAQYRGVAGRSIKVGPSTSLDAKTLEAVAARPNSLIIDCTYLPADAVLRAAVRRLEVLSP